MNIVQIILAGLAITIVGLIASVAIGIGISLVSAILGQPL